MLRQYELVERVKAYDPDADEDLLNRAYVFSVKAHGSQLRASGDPYFSHPVEVAGILTDLHLDDETIATGILHDTLEDTVATPADIERLFGPNVLRLVDGVTKLSRIEAQTETERAAENLRKFLVAMSGDIRVLLVKLADRLHNMRTLHFIKSAEKRQRISRETMDIYAPLAGRIGMYEFMEEMEELAFRQLEPEAHASIVKRLADLREGGGDLVEAITADVQAVLAAKAITAEVQGREKRPYSIWRKMQRRHLGFEKLADVIGFRVIVEQEEECYRALGAIHTRWPLVPGRFKDFISTPRRNGYRSGLQTGRGRQGARCALPMGARPARNPRTCRYARGTARAYASGDVSGSGLLLHAQGGADPVACRLYPGRFRLCGPHLARRHLRGCQGERHGGAAALQACERRSGRDPAIERAAARSDVGGVRGLGQGARRDPPPCPCARTRAAGGAGREHVRGVGRTAFDAGVGRGAGDGAQAAEVPRSSRAVRGNGVRDGG